MSEKVYLGLGIEPDVHGFTRPVKVFDSCDKATDYLNNEEINGIVFEKEVK